MAMRDEIKEQTIKWKDMNRKEKWGYFWEYYKIHVIVTVIVIIAVTSIIHAVVTDKPYAFYGMMINAMVLDGSSVEEDFSKYAEIDAGTYDCFIDTTSTLSLTSSSEYELATAQKLIALVQTKELDVVTINSSLFSNYAGNEMFADLRTVMTGEELAAYGDNIYYVDSASFDSVEDETEDISAEVVVPTQEEIEADAEAHRYPEDMSDPIPVGIFLNDAAFITSSGCYSSDMIPVAGISVACERPDTAVTFIQYLWETSFDRETGSAY